MPNLKLKCKDQVQKQVPCFFFKLKIFLMLEKRLANSQQHLANCINHQRTTTKNDVTLTFPKKHSHHVQIC